MRRMLGIALGIGTQCLFAFTVWHLFWFLKGSEPAAGSRGNLLLDAGLASQFAASHSFLLLPAVRHRLTQIIPEAFYGSFYCIVTCVGLLAMFGLWQPSATVVWHFDGATRSAIQLAFVGSWVALLYSLRLTGLGYQTGWTTWWHWLRRKKLGRRRFEPRGAYLRFRHPVYLSFLGLVWFTPVVTLDRAVLTGIWTIYIAIGSHLKDERMAYYLGESYRAYQSRVTGYPGIWFGSLGRVPAPRPQIGRAEMPVLIADPQIQSERPLQRRAA